MTFVVGVDGGGTKVRAVIADTSGSELGRAEAVGAVVTVDNPGRGAEAVRVAVRAAAEDAGVQLPGALMWAGLAGAGHSSAKRAVSVLLNDGSLSDRVCVGTDVEAAFFAAFGDDPGMLLIAGTGSALWARSPTGEIVRVGGWGRYLGDEGSGYAIGLMGLRRVVRAEDGRDAETALRARLLSDCGVESVQELISWVELSSKGQVAALAPSVIEAGNLGDSAAAQIVTDSARDLADQVRAAVHSAGPWKEDPPLVLWGGLIATGGPLRPQVTEALRAVGVQLSSIEPDPPMGAARLALGQL
jgi:N-acetylglucosamine kinase-like BadF-type ATPase